MDIDEFLDNEAAKLGGKANIVNKSSGGKHDNETFFDQLESVRSQLRENKLDGALRDFDYLKSRYTDMTKKQLSENRYIFNELLRINQELISKIDAQKTDLEKRKQIINKLLNNANTRLGNGELDLAYKLYIEINEVLKNISNIFYEEKNRLNYIIMSFAAELFPKMQEKAQNDFENTKNQILQEIHNAYQFLQQNNGQLPAQSYEKINSLFQQMPQGHIYEKALIYNDILKLFRSSSFSGETSSLIQEMIKQQEGYANKVLNSEQQRAQPEMPGPNQNYNDMQSKQDREKLNSQEQQTNQNNFGRNMQPPEMPRSNPNYNDIQSIQSKQDIGELNSQEQQTNQNNFRKDMQNPEILRPNQNFNDMPSNQSGQNMQRSNSQEQQINQDNFRRNMQPEMQKPNFNYDTVNNDENTSIKNSNQGKDEEELKKEGMFTRLNYKHNKPDMPPPPQ